MAINMAGINSVLQAYASGQQFKRRKQLDAQALLQQEAENQFKDRQLTQHDEQITDQKANTALNRSRVATELQQNSAATGLAPAGFTSTETPDGEIEYSNSNLGVKFKLPKPEVYAAQVAERTRIAMQPKLEAEQATRAAQLAMQKELAETNQNLRTKGNVEVENIRAGNRKALEEEKRKAEREKSQLDYDKAIAVANIRANATRAHAGAVNRLADSEKLLSPSEAETFDLPYGSTRQDAFGKKPGVKLTPSQTSKLASLDSLDTALAEVAVKIEKNPQFFKGPIVGGLKEAGRKIGVIGRKEIDEDLRGSLGQIEAQVAKERAGTSFTENEQKLLETYLVRASQAGDITSAKANIRNFQNYIHQTRADLLRNSVGRTKPASATETIKIGGKLIAIEDVK